jgi:hypothetical protein
MRGFVGKRCGYPIDVFSAVGQIGRRSRLDIEQLCGGGAHTR